MISVPPGTQDQSSPEGTLTPRPAWLYSSCTFPVLSCGHSHFTWTPKGLLPRSHWKNDYLSKGKICCINMVKVKLLSHVQLFATSWTVALQAPPSMGFSRQEYWSGLPFPSPRDLPDPGIEPRSPALEADALTSEPGFNKYIYMCSPPKSRYKTVKGL